MHNTTSAVIDETGTHVLDNAAWHSLTGPLVGFATTDGTRARRFRPDVSPMVGIQYPTGADTWTELHALVGNDAVAISLEPGTSAPEGWDVLDRFTLHQLTDDDVADSLAAIATTPLDPSLELVRLGEADAAAMIELVARTEPGPFLDRTIEVGAYFGVKADGVLVAMAGERLRPAGWTEISAVCTAPEFRGRGLAARLVLAVTEHVHSRGDRAFLHVIDGNPAQALYERIGFRRRADIEITFMQVVDGAR